MTNNALLVAYDDDDGSRRALDFAIERAKALGAPVHLVHVLQWSPYSFLTQEELAERHKRRNEEVARAESKVVAPALARLRDAGVATEAAIRYGNPAEIICEIAEAKGVGQIVVGRRGGSKLSERLFGGVASALVQAAPVPVTVVP